MHPWNSVWRGSRLADEIASAREASDARFANAGEIMAASAARNSQRVQHGGTRGDRCGARCMSRRSGRALYSERVRLDDVTDTLITDIGPLRL